MSKKPKYTYRNTIYAEVMSANNHCVAQCSSITMARKIARALNAMEDKPKAKPFKFDWSGIDPKYKWRAMDEDGEWCAYVVVPSKRSTYWESVGVNCLELGNKLNTYPGDWRNSLQKRP